MFEDLFNMVERAVTALETIAASTGADKCKCPPETVNVEPPAPLPETVAETPDPETAPSAECPPYGSMDYAELKRECEKRGITVAPRTRAKTLVKMLEADDQKFPTPVPSDDPAPDAPPAEDPEDPFAVAGPPDNADSTYTVDDVRGVLRKVMELHAPDVNAGSAKVTEIIKKHAGVTKLGMVTPKSFNAIVGEAEELLKGAAE